MKNPIGFKEVRSNIIRCLENGNIQHEIRGDIDLKNLLSTGEVDVGSLIEILKKSSGSEYENSGHHSFSLSVMVHIIKTKFDGVDWYIKCYFVEHDCFFISVHN